jgi:S1-C subfamily serine protease
LRSRPRIDAIGSPGGKSGIYEFSITQGIVSSVEREYDGNPVFQISAAINHGNSGGPLIERFGRCVGVNTFGEGTSELSAIGTRVGSDIQNVNFAIKINEAKSLLSKINR